MEAQIKIAAKLYECRDTAKQFMGKDFHTKLKPYMELVKATMRDNKLCALKALLKISETETYQNSGMAQLLFMAAAVEIMEPSPGQE